MWILFSVSENIANCSSDVSFPIRRNDRWSHFWSESSSFQITFDGIFCLSMATLTVRRHAHLSFSDYCSLGFLFIVALIVSVVDEKRRESIFLLDRSLVLIDIGIAKEQKRARAIDRSIDLASMDSQRIIRNHLTIKMFLSFNSSWWWWWWCCSSLRWIESIEKTNDRRGKVDDDRRLKQMTKEIDLTILNRGDSTLIDWTNDQQHSSIDRRICLFYLSSMIESRTNVIHWRAVLTKTLRQQSLTYLFFVL